MKQTTYLLIGAAAAALAAPAHADGPYIGIEGGVSLKDKITVDVDTPPADGRYDRAATARTKVGIDGDVIIGYDFGPFRLEAEGGYKNAKYRSLTIENAGILPTGVTVPVGTVVDNERDLEIWSGMVNALVEIGRDDGFQIYGGGGAGVARLELPVEVATVGTVIDDNKTDFAWQLIGGARFPVTQNIDLGVKYRYFNLDDFRLTGANGNDLRANYSAHSVLASLIVNFGRQSEPAPE
ncbi:outer membrane protein, partial [Erythrobacter sp. CCH5-A1]|uniref:outer membrane protein n=1 Tax=Erythrobacter sp. CCH5-A1 TaxID=1768792 RepID=UPI000AA1ADC8